MKKTFVQWYFVCSVCDAKWYAPHRRYSCPRCGESANSNEQQTPPWVRTLADTTEWLDLKDDDDESPDF